MSKFDMTFVLKWWQIAIYETALISLGILIGKTWPTHLDRITPYLWAIFIVGAVYMWRVWWGQMQTQAKDTDSNQS